jgi:inactivated superfamily I helicase
MARLWAQEEKEFDWSKEDNLGKEEEAATWTKTIELLEKVYKDFGSKKDKKAVWECKGDYREEDKTLCKKEVIQILKLCKKEYVIVDKPSVANAIYVNRLNKREATRKNNEKS